MEIGIVGLGRMGSGIARRLLRAGHEALVYDRDPGPGRTLEAEGARAAPSLKALVEGLTSRPRAVWCMLPAGAPTEQTVSALGELLERGDVIIDGGNSFYKDDIRRAKSLGARGVDYVDCGTSGGVWGLERGFCMMIGGPKAAVDRLDPIFLALAPGESGIPRTNGREGRDPRVELGYLHAGPAGAGHFVKMIHNGVEYGLMQAYAEGFDILKGKNAPTLASEERFELDVADVAEVWRRGSVVSSWLLDLSAIALAKDPSLSDFSGAVEDSGEGRWTLEAAIEEAVPADVLASALFTRFRSRQEHTFAERLLSAMRFGFGGHLESHGPHAARNPAPPETPPHAGSEPRQG